MLTVEEVNKTFAEKGLHIKLPLPNHFLVRSLDVLEKKGIPGGVGLLLNVRFVNDQDEEVSDLFLCEGRVEGKRKREIEELQIKTPPKSKLLPLRSKEGFESEDEDEAEDYLRGAISHLLQDKGYHLGEGGGVDLYFQRGEVGFFVNLAVRSDEKALERAKELVELRQKHGVDHEYGLIIPAFQESLGISLLAQERWIWRNQEYLSAHRIGVYAVDNVDPNRLYAFTIYPRERELRRFFIATAPQWSLVRERYVLSRGKRREAEEP
jgi:hypothetical protein